MSLKLVIQNKVINNLSHFSSDYLKQQLDQTQDKESDNAIEIYFTLGEELFSIGEFNESLKYHQTCLEIKKKRIWRQWGRSCKALCLKLTVNNFSEICVCLCDFKNADFFY